MSEFTQAHRAMRVSSVLGEDVLLFSSFAGTEGLSRPFNYRVDVYSEDPEIDPAELLRTPLILEVDLPEGGIRYIHGLVRSFTQRGRIEELSMYRAEIVPWTWFLSLSRECRIHQNKNVLDIVKTVFDDLGFQDYDDRCSRSYPDREYCVQYRESHLNFVSRLMEEEGIFTFFEHTSEAHTLVLADGNVAFEPVQGHADVRMWSQALRHEDGITSLEREHSAHVGQVTLEDYDWLQPALSLRCQLTGDGPEELYDYHPRRYVTNDDGDRHTRLLLEMNESRQEVIYGRAKCRHFESGRAFEILDHYREDVNQEYALIQVTHAGRVSDYWARGGDEGVDHLDYDVNFVAIPTRIPFRPPRLAAKPTIQGLQTATVVGKAGEEIWTDEHGRIKVQFHWDREGQYDENSSCWVRVATPWAGKGWGQVHLPRIEQEVVVEFLEGDPDRPLVTGSVYNAEQTPPYELPSDQTKSGMKSRSSKGGGGYNEISIDDKKGSEQVVIHAQKDMSTTVLNDQTTSVGHDRSVSVGNDQSTSVGNDQSVSVGANRSIQVGADRSETVGADATLSVSADRTQTVGGRSDESVGGDRGVHVGGSMAHTVAGSAAIGVQTGDLTLKTDAGKIEAEGTAGVAIGSPADVEVSGMNVKTAADLEVSIDGTMIKLSGKTEITLSVGPNFVKIDPTGVTIFGTIVKIN